MSEIPESCPVCGCLLPEDAGCPVCMLGNARQDSGLSEAERIFQLALSYHSGEREAFVRAACREKSDLLTEVRLLMEGYAEEGGDEGLLTVPGEAENARAAWAAPREEEAGARIGHFELVRVIGRGGMGSVWEARQTKPVVRRVALKVIKLGMDTREVVSRFERERQALALMDHPNIARVFEAGATELGRPYFVMELVEGRAITWFCQEESLNIRARLELFLQLCGAIEHAHQKGVIHRDLKPSNILVAADGSLKVIDFGVAKATREIGDPDQTRQAQVLGTPAYMSPEQASGNGVDVDTRTDVYALGVVLYEMLCGMLPFDPARLSATGVEEMQRILREEEPQRPSTQWNAARLPGPAEPWRRAIRGDLDWITLKCLEKDRHHRYASARALADDVQACLQSRPVTAAPHRTSYYVGKWVARHRVAFGAGVAVTGALLLGTIVSLAQARRAEAEADRATAARAEAERLLVISHHEEGKAWLERARGLQKDRNFFAAKLMAGRALGFEGFGRSAMDAAFQERYPVLLDPKIPESAAARRIVASFGDYSMMWQSPSAAHHDGPVQAVGFSPDGSLVASCGAGEDVIRVRDAREGGIRFLLASPAPRPVTLHFSPDGKWLAAGGQSDQVPVWDTATGQLAFVLEGAERRITHVHFSADGSLLGVSGATGGVAFWEMGTRRPLPSIGAENGPVTHFCLSHDNRCLAMVTADAVFRVYGMADRKLRWEFRGLPQQTVYSLAMHPDGKRIYGGFALGRILTWDPETGKRLEVPFDDQRHPVSSLTVSADGRFLASGNGKGTIRLSDAVTGKEVKAWEGHPGRVLDLAFSADGGWLASGGEDQTLRIWNCQDGKARYPVTGHTSPVVGVAVSPDGRTLASASEDQTIQLWDPAAGRSLALVTGELGGVRSLDFSPSGAILMAGGRSGLLRFWRMPDGERTIDLKGLHAGGVNAVKFVREDVLATAGADGAVRVYQAATGNESARHLAHRGEVLCLDAERGGRIASGGMDRTVMLWEPGHEGPPRALQGHVSPVTAVRFSPDGRTLASADRSGTLRFWDLESGLLKNSVISSAQPLTSIDYHPDGTRLVATGQDGVLRIWNVMTWKLEAVLEGHLRAVHGVRFSQDGAALVSGSADQTVALWQARGEEKQSRQAHRGRVSDLLWNEGALTSAGADGMVREWEETWLHRCTEWAASNIAAPCLATHGSWLVIAAGSGWVEVRNRADGSVLRAFQAHRGRIDAANFSPDGKQLATASQDGKLRIWETESWKLLEQRTLREVGNYRPVADYSLSFSRDGTRLFGAGDQDGRIRIWLTSSYQELESLPAHPVQVRSLHAHPQLDLLAAGAGDGTVSIWNTQTLQQVAVLKHHTGEVFDARFDPSGRWLASAGEDQTIVIWDTASWQALDVLEGCIGAVRDLAFDATGGRLASGGDSGQLKIWDLGRREATSWAALFGSYHNDGLRFTTQSGVTAASLAEPLAPHGLGVPPDSWLEQRRGNPPPGWSFQRALQARNWEAAVHWLGQLPETAPERQAFAEDLSQEVLHEEQELPPARVEALLEEAERLAPENVRLRQARAWQAFRQGSVADALAKLGAPGSPPLDEVERLRYQILLKLGDFRAAAVTFGILVADDPSGRKMTEHYHDFSDALHRSLTPPSAGVAGTGLDTLRALTLIEHFRRAASLIPYDETRLKAWITQVAEWRALLTPPIPLIPPGAEWHYLDDGSDPGPDWQRAFPGKDPWRSGGSPLGVSAMKKTTTIRRNLSDDPAQPSIMAFYFRHAFARPGLEGRPNLLVTTQYDDGIILYLNGREIRRINMDPGPVTPTTGASQYQNKPGLTSFSIPSALLEENNVLAARVHQREPTSTDIFFDVVVSATAASTENWLANLSRGELDNALSACAAYLPPAAAAAWLPVAEFAFADKTGEPAPGPAPAHAWLIRARLQHARGCFPAMEEALARGRAIIPADVDQRTALERDLWLHFAEVPLRTW